MKFYALLLLALVVTQGNSDSEDKLVERDDDDPLLKKPLPMAINSDDASQNEVDPVEPITAAPPTSGPRLLVDPKVIDEYMKSGGMPTGTEQDGDKKLLLAHLPPPPGKPPAPGSHPIPDDLLPKQGQIVDDDREGTATQHPNGERNPDEPTPLEKKRQEIGSNTTCVQPDFAKCSMSRLDECQHFRIIQCKNGAACTNDQCRCHYCYANEDCSAYNDMAMPMFLESSYAVKFYAFKTQTYSGVRANDNDVAFCRSYHQRDCPCGTVVYSLDFDESVPEDLRARFKIDQDTSKVTFAGVAANSKLPTSPVQLFVVAGNPTPPGLQANMTYKRQNRVSLQVTLSSDVREVFTDVAAPPILKYEPEPEIPAPKPVPLVVVDSEASDMSDKPEFNAIEKAFEMAAAKGKPAADYDSHEQQEQAAQAEGGEESGGVEKKVNDEASAPLKQPAAPQAAVESLQKSFGIGSGDMAEHSRRKRSPTNTTVPGEFSVDITATLSAVRVGEVNSITVNFSLPQDTVGKTLKATVIANPRFRVYTINNPTITGGANIQPANLATTVVPVTISDQNDQYVDSFTVDFGIVKNTGASTTDWTQNDILLKFDVITRNSSDLLENMNYPIDVYYEFGGSVSFGTREVGVLFTPSDWSMNILPNVTIVPASTGNVEKGSTVVWIVNITNLTDAASTFRINAFVPVAAQPAGVLLTNIYRISSGAAFVWGSADFGNVRASPGVATMQTPWIEVTNKNFWVDINPGTSDYVTYAVVATIDSAIDMTQMYAVGIQVETVNYNYSYSNFFTFSVVSTSTLSSTGASATYKATLAGSKSSMVVGSAISVEFQITPTNSYSDYYEFTYSLPTTASFGFVGAAFAAQSNTFEPFAIDTITAVNGGTSVSTASLPTTQVSSVVIRTKRTGTAAVSGLSRSLYFYATFKLISVLSSTNGTTVSIIPSVKMSTSGSTYTESPSLSVKVYTSCITDPNPTGALTVTTVPALGDYYIFPWGAQAFYVSVSVPDGETLADLAIEVDSPLDPTTGKPIFILERAYLADVDPGLVLVQTSSSVSLNAATGVAKLTFPMAYVQSTSGTPETFRVFFAFYMPYNYTSTFTPNSNYTLPVTLSQTTLAYCGVTSGATLTSYGGFTVTFLNERPVTSLLPNAAPRIIWTPLTSTVCKKGGLVTYNVDAVLPPRYNAWTELDVIVPDFELDYVGVSHVQPKATFTDTNYPVRYTRNNNSYVMANKGSYIWGYTTNIDPVQPITVNLGQITVRLMNNPNLVDGSSHEFIVGLTMLPWRWAFENPIITASTSKYVFTDMPTASFTKKNTESTITQGAGAIYRVRLQTVPDSVGRYQFDFTATRGSSICSVVVINKGINVGYANNSYYPVTAVSPDTSRTNQSWSVAIDFLANAKRVDSTNPSVDNDLYVEVGVCIPSALSLTGTTTVALAPSTTMTIAATVTVDETFIYSSSITNTIGSSQLVSEVPQQVNVTIMGWANDVDYVHKSLKTLINVSIDTTPHSAGIYTMNVTFPVETINNEAYGIVENIAVIAYGKNIICASMISYTAYSATASSQLNSGQLVFGIVNSGSWTQMPDYLDYLQAIDDNRVTIELQLRHTDHFWNTVGTARPYDLTLTYNNSDNVVHMTGYMPPLNVRGIESPDFTTSWTATPVPAESTAGTIFYIYGTIAHTQNSTAHGYLVRLQFFVPPYVSAGELLSADGTQSEPTLSNATATSNSIDIVWPVILMEETATFNISVIIDPGQSFGATIGLIRVEIVSALKARKLVKVLMNDQYAISGAPIPITIDQMTLDTYGTDSSRGQFTFTPPSCNAPLGMTTGVITDCMLFASSTLTSFQNRVLANATTGKPGRLNAPAAWMPYPRGNPFFSNEYLIISIGAPATIAAIQIQGDAGSMTQYVAAVQIQYSVDGTRWQTFVDPLTLSTTITLQWPGTRTSADDVVTYKFDPPITGAAFVRLIPKLGGSGAGANPYLPMRVELLGCAPDNRNTQCLADFLVMPSPNAPNTPAEYAIRSYIWIEPLLLMFACSQPSVDEFATCSRFDSTNNEWRDVPVSAVTAYDSASGVITAVTQTGTYAISHDNGFTWVESDAGANADIMATLTANDKYKTITASYEMCAAATADVNAAIPGFTYLASATVLGTPGQTITVKQSGIVYGTTPISNDLYYWGSGSNWNQCT